MKINATNIVSITDADQNFSKATCMVDKSGAAVTLRNSVPTYVSIGYEAIIPIQKSMDEKVETIAKRVLGQNIEALWALAK